MFLRYIILIVFIVADHIDSYTVVSSTTDCDPNRVYKKQDVTCICSKEGRWPHQNCSVVFNFNEDNTRICEPDSYVTVDCNICRCSKAGSIDRDFCTKHNCDGYNHIKIIRRSNDKNKCEPNHWYALTGCRLCYCINRNNLLCNSGATNPKKVPLGTYNLTDCGSNLLSDINKLLSTKDPLGTNRSSKKKKEANVPDTEYDTQTAKTTPTTKLTTKDIFSVIFNREGNREEIELLDNSDNNDLDSSNEDISEADPQAFSKDVSMGRLVGNTVIPFENDEDYVNDSIGSDRNNSEEMGDNRKESDNLHKSQEENSELVENNKQTNTENRPTKKIQRSETVINLNIPGILERMFNFRKSMVSIDSVNCVPGSTLAVHCNTCFCLKNGKMLCTQKKCY